MSSTQERSGWGGWKGCEIGAKGKTTRSAYAATALRTVGIESFRISLPAGPRSVIGTDCHPVTSGISARLRVC